MTDEHMPDDNKTEEFLKKLTPCIERGELEKCVEDAARMAGEMGIGAKVLLDLSIRSEENKKFELEYVLALAAVHDLKKIKKADAYYNAGFAAFSIGELKEAEKYFKNALELNSKDADIHYNYAVLLYKLKRYPDAEEHYKKTIKIDPEFCDAYYGYAYLLHKQERITEAEVYYKKAIELNPKDAKAHGAYGFLLLKNGNKKVSWKETEVASNLFKDKGRITSSYLVKAFFYLKYSEKNFDRKNYQESSKDANNAGEEFLKAADVADGDLKNKLILQGNILKAKSFVRKIPEKSWQRKILNRFGKNPNISELMDNLSEAAKYYEKASCCSAGERKDICNACFSSIRVFSEILLAMNALIQNDDAEIDKDKWLSSLELAHKIYTDKKLINGAALVDTLKQLIKCVNEMAEHRKIGLHIQEERLGKCYNNLIDVSEKLDGALGVIAEHSIEAIRGYAKKEGMGFIGQETKVPFWREYAKEIILATAAIFAAVLMDKLLSLNILSRFFD